MSMHLNIYHTFTLAFNIQIGSTSQTLLMMASATSNLLTMCIYRLIRGEVETTLKLDIINIRIVIMVLQYSIDHARHLRTPSRWQAKPLN